MDVVVCIIVVAAIRRGANKSLECAGVVSCGGCKRDDDTVVLGVLARKMRLRRRRTTVLYVSRILRALAKLQQTINIVMMKHSAVDVRLRDIVDVARCAVVRFLEHTTEKTCVAFGVVGRATSTIICCDVDLGRKIMLDIKKFLAPFRFTHG